MSTSSANSCPQCTLEEVSVSGRYAVCDTCGFEWEVPETSEAESGERIVRDAVGNVLVDGDSVTLIKDLKVKGSSLVLKQGTKVKGIRLVDGDHEVDCRIDGMSMALKACFLKKA